MMLSNEPGYYKAGAYGIRIENLILVEKRDIPGAEREMHGFETLTFAPIDLALVEPSIMTADEIAWLNAYHAKVREIVRPSRARPPRPGWKRRGRSGRAGVTLRPEPPRASPASALAHQRQPCILVDHLDAELARLVELGAGARPGDDEVVFFDTEPATLAPSRSAMRLGLLAGHLLQRAGEHHGLAGDGRCGGRPPRAARGVTSRQQLVDAPRRCAARRRNRRSHRPPTAPMPSMLSSSR